MSVKGQDRAVVQIPLNNGLALKGDPRAQNPPNLEILKDAEFDDIGGIRTRYPMFAQGTSIVGGGTVSNFRKTVRNGDELLLFTDKQVYTWNDNASAWALIGEHLAISQTETDVFTSQDDETSCDRAELNNIAVYAWIDAGAIWVASIDQVTGSVNTPPHKYVGIGGLFVRLVALQTRILLFTVTAGLFVIAIDPANVASSLGAGAVNVGTGFSTGVFDVERIPGADTAIVAAILTPTTSYLVAKVTAGLVISTSTKARVADACIALSCDPTSTTVQVVRSSGGNIQGDRLNISSLADVFTATAVGTATVTNSLTCAHRSVQDSGQYRCYAFWADSQTSDPTSAWSSKFNWVDTNNAHGSAGNFVRQLALASRAFDYNGQVYVWCAFDMATTNGAVGLVNPLQLQNTNLLVRDDQVTIARSAVNRAAGVTSTPTTTVLPGVQSMGSKRYKWCQTIRRTANAVFFFNNGAIYAQRGPSTVDFSFDSNNARRTVRLGNTLYITGSQPLQYDGLQLRELGFLPYVYSISALASATAGTLDNGDHYYKATYAWLNAQGEIDRSTTATVVKGNPGAVNKSVDLTIVQNQVTLKNTPVLGLPGNSSIEIWRTTLSPQADSPFYLISSLDPSAGGSNGYAANIVNTVPLTFNDGMIDSVLITKQINPESGGILEPIAPPPHTIVIASDLRLFIAGVANDPDRVWYSKQRNDGEVAAFNDALVIVVPKAGGDITGLAIFRETLFVFRETAVYAFGGDGLDNTGNGQNYGPPKQVSRDVGAVNHESIVVGPFGILFKSDKGWYVIDDQWNPRYVGAPVALYDSDTITSAVLVEKQHQVRVTTSARMLVWDFLVNKWAEWTIADGIDSTMWDDVYLYLSSSTGAMQQDSSFVSTPTGYGIDVETAWIKMADLQGAGRVRRLAILGEWRSDCTLRIRLARDYQGDGSGGWIYFQDKLWVPTQSTPGTALQVKIGPRIQQCESFKVRITALSDFDAATFHTATDFSVGGVVTTGGANWTATLTSNVLGAEGNNVSINVYTNSGTDTEVRDHQRFTPSTGWVAAPYTVGIRVGTNSQTVSQVEAAIARSSTLVTVTSPDPNPANRTNNTGTTHSGACTGGDIIAATGESIKLTGIALEVGIKPGIYKRLSAGQKA